MRTALEVDCPAAAIHAVSEVRSQTASGAAGYENQCELQTSSSSALDEGLDAIGHSLRVTHIRLVNRHHPRPAASAFAGLGRSLNG